MLASAGHRLFGPTGSTYGALSSFGLLVFGAGLSSAARPVYGVPFAGHVPSSARVSPLRPDRNTPTLDSSGRNGSVASQQRCRNQALLGGKILGRRSPMNGLVELILFTTDARTVFSSRQRVSDLPLSRSKTMAAFASSSVAHIRYLPLRRTTPQLSWRQVRSCGQFSSATITSGG